MKLRWDHPLWRRLAPFLATKLVNAYLGSCRKELAPHPEAKKLIEAGVPVLYSSWHCHLLCSLYYFRYLNSPSPVVLMASPSRDGEFIGEVTRRWGYLVFSGSRQKGGVQALQKMAAYLRGGHSGGLVADGSRGPARMAQKGVVFLAREGRAPILPLAVASRRKIIFNTWDRFELPLPLSRMAVMVGEPFHIEPEARGPLLEARRRELETRLNLLCDQSQEYFSR
ncbi:MAG: hypothetical protein A2Z73_00125 [Deltaproteobacteria bacterium RBG_13_60_28]|nr:MAG: hypothetical protein A2Z73_00125 [Deltaproteobacteria bacterium RBG_13_60_28]